MTCTGCYGLAGEALDRYVAARIEQDRGRYTRQEIARLYNIPIVLLPEEETTS